MPKLHLQVLKKNQTKVFSQLNFVGKEKFYLAGGTALALHLGHRTSLDFDFYTQSHFDSSVLYQKIEDVFGKNVKATLREKDTLFCKILDVDCSFFWYKYPLLKTTIKTKGPPIVGIEDIAAMKLVSIIQRPAKRDYIDIFFLLRILSLEKIFSFTQKRYPNFNEYLALRALTYFDDLKDEEKREIKVFDKNFSWKKAKEEIFEEVRKYQLGMIKEG